MMIVGCARAARVVATALERSLTVVYARILHSARAVRDSTPVANRVCLHAVDATHRSFHTDTKGFATNFMTDFKTDIESKAKFSTVRFSSLAFSTDVTAAAPLGDDLDSTKAQTNAIEYKGGWTNTQ